VLFCTGIIGSDSLFELPEYQLKQVILQKVSLAKYPAVIYFHIMIVEKCHKKRAISDTQKLQRSGEIIAAARNLLQKFDYGNITMEQIAREVQLSKATMFLYFKSKEDLFLSLAEQVIKEWSLNLNIDIMDSFLIKKNLSIDSFTELLINSVNNPVVLKIFSILDDTLEKNIDFDRAFRFKSFLKCLLSPLGETIEQFLPKLDKGDGVILLNNLFICLIGSYKVCTPSGIVEKIIQQPGMEMFKRDFTQTLTTLANCFITGFLSRKLLSNN